MDNKNLELDNKDCELEQSIINRECCYCVYQEAVSDAENRGMSVTKLSKPIGEAINGVDIFIHPKKIKINKENQHKYQIFFYAWLGELPDHCVCEED